MSPRRNINGFCTHFRAIGRHTVREVVCERSMGFRRQKPRKWAREGRRRRERGGEEEAEGWRRRGGGARSLRPLKEIVDLDKETTTMTLPSYE